MRRRQSSTDSKGKFAIHPAQIDIINETFSPSDAEGGRACASRNRGVSRKRSEVGRGSTSLDGKVVDVPVVKERAGSCLELASSRVAGELSKHMNEHRQLRWTDAIMSIRQPINLTG